MDVTFLNSLSRLLFYQWFFFNYLCNNLCILFIDSFMLPINYSAKKVEHRFASWSGQTEWRGAGDWHGVCCWWSVACVGSSRGLTNRVICGAWQGRGVGGAVRVWWPIMNTKPVKWWRRLGSVDSGRHKHGEAWLTVASVPVRVNHSLYYLSVLVPQGSF